VGTSSSSSSFLFFFLKMLVVYLCDLLSSWPMLPFALSYFYGYWWFICATLCLHSLCCGSLFLAFMPIGDLLALPFFFFIDYVAVRSFLLLWLMVLYASFCLYRPCCRSCFLMSMPVDDLCSFLALRWVELPFVLSYFDVFW
jgi:hypothetical protein